MYTLYINHNLQLAVTPHLITLAGILQYYIACWYPITGINKLVNSRIQYNCALSTALIPKLDTGFSIKDRDTLIGRSPAWLFQQSASKEL